MVKVQGPYLLYNLDLLSSIYFSSIIIYIHAFISCQHLIYEIFHGADKDWEDIRFGVDNQVDFYAVSFVKDARVVHELKDYLRSTFIYIYINVLPIIFSLIHIFVSSHSHIYIYPFL